MRLDKYLVSCHVGSRQEVKQYIKKHRVKVNRTVAVSPEQKINETLDEITFDQEILIYEEYYYIMLNKPAGYVCSVEEKGQKSVMELIHEPFRDKLFPVGRLDKDTEGLLLLTNDGKLDHNLRSPKKHVKKIYHVLLEKEVRAGDKELFQKGLDIGDEKLTLPANLIAKTGDRDVLLEITEGRYHQVKRMFEAAENKVLYLERLQMKDLTLDPALQRGEYRRLTEEEIIQLKEKTNGN